MSNSTATFNGNTGNVPKWSPMEMHWKERLSNGTELSHTYRPLLNQENGSLYTDNKMTFVTKKCFFLLLVRPFHAAAKTLYHICLPISIPREMYLAMKKEWQAQKKEQQKNNLQLIKAGMMGCENNIADIFRTPLYGTALTICACAGFILGMVHSEKIYDLRTTAGKIELSLLRGDKKSIWMLAPCFQKTTNLNDLEKDWGTITHSDTNYDGLSSKEKAEANLARAVFQNRRNHRAIVYCCKPWPKGVALDSATYRTC